MPRISIRYEIRKENLSVAHVVSKDQRADVATKVLPQDVSNGRCQFILGM